MQILAHYKCSSFQFFFECLKIFTEKWYEGKILFPSQCCAWQPDRCTIYAQWHSRGNTKQNGNLGEDNWFNLKHLEVFKLEYVSNSQEFRLELWFKDTGWDWCYSIACRASTCKTNVPHLSACSNHGYAASSSVLWWCACQSNEGWPKYCHPCERLHRISGSLLQSGTALTTVTIWGGKSKAVDR